MSTSANDRSPLASPLPADRPRRYRPTVAPDILATTPAVLPEDSFATRPPGLSRSGRAPARSDPAPIPPAPSPAPPRVLLLTPGDRSPEARAPLERTLLSRGFAVQWADSAKADPLERRPPEIILVDPAFAWGADAVSALNRLSAGGSELPAPLLVVLGGEPVDAMLDQLEAVIRSRRAAIGEERLVWRDLSLDVATQRLQRGETALRLSGKGFVLFRHLMRAPARAHPRAELLTAVWGARISVEPRTLDVHIRRLRVTLRATSADPVIYTVRGIGYSLNPSA